MLLYFWDTTWKFQDDFSEKAKIIQDEMKNTIIIKKAYTLCSKEMWRVWWSDSLIQPIISITRFILPENENEWALMLIFSSIWRNAFTQFSLLQPITALESSFNIHPECRWKISKKTANVGRSSYGACVLARIYSSNH